MLEEEEMKDWLVKLGSFALVRAKNKEEAMKIVIETIETELKDGYTLEGIFNKKAITEWKKGFGKESQEVFKEVL